MPDFQTAQREEKKSGTAHPVIQTERCKGCGICTMFCPPKILALSGELNSFGYPTVAMTDEKACTHCLRCCQMCPDVVFTFIMEENEPCWKH